MSIFRAGNKIGRIGAKVLAFDGGMGTLLSEALGGKPFQSAELVLSKPELIEKIHREYVEAGSQIIGTNTFSANPLKLAEIGLEKKCIEINEKAVEIARNAAGGKDVLVAASIGPLGKWIKPLGDLEFEAAVRAFREQIAGLEKADFLLFETFTDLKEAKAAAIAAKEAASLPFAISFSFEGGTLPTGSSPECCAVLAEAVGAFMTGVNCGSSPADVIAAAEKYSKSCNLPILAYPNAGLPKLVEGKTVFSETAEGFAGYAERLLKAGVSVIGGCCGSTPEHIASVVKTVGGKDVEKRKKLENPVFSSRTKVVYMDKPLAVGENINPSGKKDLTAEIKEGKTSLLQKMAIEEERNGTDLIDVNVSVVNHTDRDFLNRAVTAVSSVAACPISIDSPDSNSLEKALREYCGKPLLNSVNGTKESLEEILPLAAKYGANIVALCLDDSGVPKDWEKRIEIGKKIVKEAENAGIPKKDIFVDAITLTIATGKENAKNTLLAVRACQENGWHTILGVSNISMGLPERRKINVEFLARALEAGLDLAIVDAFDPLSLDLVHGAANLEGIGSIEETSKELFRPKVALDEDAPIEEQLGKVIEFGLEEDAEKVVRKALARKVDPLEISSALIEGMNKVGKKFKRNEIFLPSVLLSANSMKISQSLIKPYLKKAGPKTGKKILFCTVEGDIHDIGKGIVISLLESNGFEVIDLGKDISAEEIVEAAKKHSPSIVCMSSLMTTTIEEMPKAIKALKDNGLKIPVMVGGAVVTEEYAGQIGAEYGSDALDAVEEVNKIFRMWKK